MNANQIATGFRKIDAGLPPFDEHMRVLVYTEGADFNGEQLFDLPALDFYADMHEDGALGEVAQAATHWIPRDEALSVLLQGQDGRVQMPKSADQAAGMVLLGEKWLQQNAPDRLRKMEASTYFSFGPDAGFELHGSAKDAEEAAQSDVDTYRDEAPDGWPEGVDQVCWGVVLQQATEIDRGPAPEGSEFDRIVDYELAGAPSLTQAPADAVCDSVQVDDSGKLSTSAFLARDLADILGVEVLAVCKALIELGFSPRSANMAVPPSEAVAVAKRIASWRIEGAAEGRELVELPAGSYGWRYTVAESAQLLRAIDKNGGLSSGGESYPNALNVHDMAGRLDVLLAAYPKLRTPPAAPARSEREIVEQTEELAAELLLWAHGMVPADEDARFRDGFSPRAVSCWQMACKAQEILTNTDAENAADEVDAEASGPAKEPEQAPQAPQETQEVESAPLRAEHVEQIAKWLEQQRTFIPATGPELAASLRSVGAGWVAEKGGK